MIINTRLSILDDLASDMRADYRDMLTYGWSVEEAEKEIISVYMDDVLEDEELAAWCILAKEEWTHGHRPGKIVLDEAIQRIDRELLSVREEEITNTDQQYLSRLVSLKELLLSPPPEPKKLYKKRPVLSPWKLGDCVVIQMTSMLFPHLEGQYAVFRVVEIEKKKQSRYSPVENEKPWLAPLFWHGNEIPANIPAILACGYTQIQPQPMLLPGMRDILQASATKARINDEQRALKAIQILLDHSKEDRNLIALWPVYPMDPSEYPLPNLQQNEKALGTFCSCYTLRWEIANWIGTGSPYFLY